MQTHGSDRGASGAAAVADPAAGWGPEVERRGRRRPRLLRWTALLAVILVLVACLAVLVLWWQLEREPVSGLANHQGGPLHVLITGSDSRDGLGTDEQRELSTGRADVYSGERADTILLLTVDGPRAALLAFPRDLWVERCDGTTGRINAAVSIDGPGCLVRTVRDLSGIDVHHHVSVTFGGFRDVVDAVGGVELCLDEPIADRDAGIDLPAGCQVLDGPDALGFVRVRKIDDDLQRIKRQQTFVQALAREVTDPRVLLRPSTLTSLAGAGERALRVDDQLTPWRLIPLARGARALAAGDVVTHTVPVDPRTTAGGAAVLEARLGEAEELFARFRDGRVLEDVADRGEDADGSADLPAPATITVELRNGAGVNGLAGRVADHLRSEGYQVSGLANAQATDTTVVRHPPDLAPAAQRVADDLPGAVSVATDPALDHITVILAESAEP